MKKLMTMIASVAMAFGLYADGYQKLGYTIPAKADVGANTIAGYADDMETPLDEGVTVNWWATGCLSDGGYQPAAVAEDDVEGKILAVDSDTDKPLIRTFNAIKNLDGSHDALSIEDHGLFIDTKVKFTGAEDVLTTPSDAKILVWLKTIETEMEGEVVKVEGSTNLMVTCGIADVGEIIGCTNLALVAEVENGSWHQLTIRANKGTKYATFNIYLDGEQLATADGVKEFPALIGDNNTLASVGYAGTGAFQTVDLCGQNDAPAYAADPTYLTVKWNAGVAGFTVGEQKIDVTGTGSTNLVVAAGNTVVVPTFVQSPKYKLSKYLLDGEELPEDEDGNAAFTIDRYDTAELEIVAVQDRTGAGLVVDGEPVGDFPYVKDAVAALADLEFDAATITLKMAEENITDFGDWSELSGAITLDLNGKTISVDAESAWEGGASDEDHFETDCMIQNANGAEITITNSVTDVGQLVGSASVAILCNENGVVYLTKANIKYDGAINSFNNEGDFMGSMTIFGGKFKPQVTFMQGDTHNGLAEGLKWVELGGGWWEVSAAEPPPPTEKGFKVIISGVETKVDTLAEAFAQADDNSTITMLADVDDAVGIIVDTKKTLTVDFGGFTYTVNKPGAGSPNTKTQAFQLLKDQTLTFKNGTIKASEDNLVLAEAPAKNIKRFFQSYADFTLEDMTLDGTNLYLNPADNAMCEFANGTVAIKGETSILAKKDNLDAISIDTWKGSYPDGVNVTIDTTGTISSVKVWTEGTGDYTPGEVALNGGTITELKVDGNDADYAITKSEDVTITTTPAGYFWDNGALAKCAAEIDGTYYNTLAAAFTAAEDDDEIVLLKDVQIEACIAVDKKVTLNIGDFDVTPKAAFTRPTGSKITIDAMFAVRYGGDFTVVGGEGVIDSSAYPTIYSPIKMTEYDETYDDSTKAKLTVNANLKGYYYAITGNGKRSGTEITINGGLLEGTIVDESAGIYHPQGGTLTINGGTIKGDTGLYIKAGDCICSVGSGAKIIATGTKKDYVAKKSGFQSTGDAFLIDNADYPGGEPSADIEGGEFVSAHGAAVASYAKAGFDPIVGFVEGGTFTGDIKIDDAIAGGNFAFGPFTPGVPQTLVEAVAKVNDVNYATLAAALDAAVEGDTVTLLADIALNDTLDIEKSVEIDLNEKTVTFGAQVNKGISAVDVDQLTIKNGTITVADSRMNISLSRAIYLLHTSAVFEDLIVDLPGFEYVINVDCDTEPDSDCWNKPLAYTLDCENVVVNGNGSLFHIENAEATLTACAATFDTTLPSFGGAHEAAIYSSCGAVTTVDGGLFTAPNALQTGNYGGDIIVKNGVFNGNIKSWMLDNDTRDFADVNKANIQIEKGKFTGNFVYADGCSAESPLLTVEISDGDFSDKTIPVKFIKPVEHKIAKWVDSTLTGYVTPGYDWVQVKAIWVVDDVATTNLVDYNTVPVQPEDPVKTGYTFTGWQPTPGAVIIEDTTYTAQFEADNITITVNYGEGIETLLIDGQPRGDGDEIALPADTKAVPYELVKDEDIKIPVFYQTNGAVKTRITENGSLAVTDGLEVTFSAKDAASDDVTEADARAALKDAGFSDATLNKFAASGEVRKFAAWVEKYNPVGDDINKSAYVQASVTLDVDLITEATEIKIADLKEVTGGAMTFKVKIAETTMATEAQLNAIKDMVKATKDVTDWTTAAKQLEVTATADVATGTVTITPVGSPAAAFMRVVIPTDVTPVGN